MNGKETSGSEGESEQSLTVAEFLESSPPGHRANISDLAEYKHVRTMAAFYLRTPELQLHCDSDQCNGLRFFRCQKGALEPAARTVTYHFLTYRCANCQRTEKRFAVAFARNSDEDNAGVMTKLGELPPFGPPVPAKLLKLIGPDREIFLKGRRCENLGLGIGAFIYYRRVVENQKDRILREIIKVSEKVRAPAASLDTLRSALNETQFSKALDSVKDALPESLLIDGHSPILLLHRALSEGVHALTDEQCLDLATSVRVVLAELAERLGQALKDEVELTKALSTLMHLKNSQT